jgi:ABC-2 type transport system ATP-binding protein
VTATLLRATGLRQVYRTKAGRERVTRVALDGVSIEVQRGQRVALVGANGSGKSTLLRLLARIEEPQGGAVQYLDEQGTELSRGESAKRTGVVFQSPGLDRLLTVRENLLAQAALYGVTDARDRVRACAERVGIADRLDDRVGALSGGLARRADLARALVSEPSLLLLDEPLAGLDASSRDVFLGLLRELSNGDPGFTLIMSSHAPDEIRLADRVIVLDAGRVVESGEPETIASTTFDGCELIAIVDSNAVAGSAVLRSWQAGDSTIVGGDRMAIEAWALEQSRRGVAVEVRSPDFVSAYRLMLARSGADEGVMA